MDDNFEERPSYYSIIPASVRYDKDLRPNEKLLYGEITSLCNKNGYCFATNEYFANLYDVHKNTISAWISNLQKKDYIISKILYKENSKEIEKRVLFLGKGTIKEIAEIYCENHSDPINEKLNRYKLNHLDPINEKLKDNNTSINNKPTTNKEKNIFEYIEENFGRTLNSIEYEVINNWNEYNFPKDLLKYAVKKAILKNIYAIGYIDKILFEWNKNNIRTVAQAQKSDENFSNRKQYKPVNNFKSSRDKLRELEEQARIDDEREALENAKA